MFRAFFAPHPAPPGWRRRRRQEGLVVGGGLVLYAVLAYLAGLGEGAMEWLDDLAWTAFSLAAGLRCLATARRHPQDSRRLAWGLLGAAALSWCVGMLYLIGGQLLQEDFSPYPTPANVLFVALAPLFALGVLAYREPEKRIGVAIRRLADLAIIGSSAAVILVILLLERFLASGESLFFQIFAILDPALFATAAVFTLSAVWLRDRREERRVLLLLAGAIVVHALADLLYFLDQLAGGDFEFRFLNFYWLGAFALQYWAAVEEDRLLVKSARQAARRVFDAGPLEAITPSALIVGMVVVALLFRENLTGRTLVVVLPLALLFGLLLGFREWWSLRIGSRLLDGLRRATARTEEILAASPAAIVTWRAGAELEPTFVSDNVASMLGYDAEELLARPGLWSERIHPEDRARVEEWIQRLGRRGSVMFEYRFRTRDGLEIWLLQRMELRRDADGRPRQVVGSLIDVTERKRLEEQLLQGRKLEAVGRLSGGIAHDFNNLLTTILSHGELAQESLGADHPARENVEAIVLAGEQAATLTRELLAFSRRTPPELRRVDLNEVALRTEKLVGRLLGGPVSLEIERAAEPVWVRADPVQLEQVLLNLVLNARDALPAAAGRLVVGVERAWLDEDFLSSRGGLDPGFYGVLYVADNGGGMAREVLDRLFEPFFTTKESGTSSGLGLAVVHGVVEQHRGLIEVSTHAGRGSAFRVYLPASGESRHVAEPPTRAAGGGETIFVVDDDEEILAVIRKALTSRGYRVLTATSAEEALARALDRREAFDLLLTDLVMPGMNGRELASSLTWERPNLKVLYMSGYAAQVLSESGVDGTSIRLLHKPLVPSRLARAIRDELDR